MNCRQTGFINPSILTMLIGGLLLVGILVYGAKSGHELPLWPAIAVTLVNLVAAVKLVFDIRKTRQQRQTAQPAAHPAAGQNRQPS